MRICVIGAGAMGSLYGARLADKGHDVTLADRWQEHVDAIARDGLLLSAEWGDLRTTPAATTDPSGLTDIDIAIILVDANTTDTAGEMARAMLAPDGFALTLQNGIGNLARLDAVLGAERVEGGLSYHSCAIAGPGHVEHTNKGPTWIGQRPGHESDRVALLATLFEEADLAPRTVPDIELLIVEKWILNSAINALCAITGLRQGEIPRTPELETYQDHILDEAFAVVAAKGIPVDADALRKAIKDQCWKKFNKPSMLQHVEARKRTEIDALNGAIARDGRELGVPTPYNDALALLIKGLEKSRMFAIDGRITPPSDSP